MFRLKNNKLLSLGMKILPVLVSCSIIFLNEAPLALGKAVPAWVAPTDIVILGGALLAAPLALRGRRPANRWYRAACWAVWPFGVLPGALIILSIVVWGITGQTPGQFTVSGVLVITGLVLLVVGIFLVGGLAVAGYIAQGTEETRQWARSLGRRNGEVENTPAQEDTPPA